MNSLISKKTILALVLSSGILISSFAPTWTVNANVKNEISVEQSDSTKSKISNYNQIDSSEKKDNSKKTQTSTNLAYNVIYYLISIFIKTNPLSRPG